MHAYLHLLVCAGREAFHADEGAEYVQEGLWGPFCNTHHNRTMRRKCNDVFWTRAVRMFDNFSNQFITSMADRIWKQGGWKEEGMKKNECNL